MLIIILRTVENKNFSLFLYIDNFYFLNQHTDIAGIHLQSHRSGLRDRQTASLLPTQHQRSMSSHLSSPHKEGRQEEA